MRPATPLAAYGFPFCRHTQRRRSLRTSLEFALLEAKNQVITIGGCAPGVGKSFVASNSGAAPRRRREARAGSGRRPPAEATCTASSATTAKRASPRRSAGSSRRSRRTTESPNLFFLPTGAMPPNPAELLGSERFKHLLTELARGFDLVLQDLPPVLAVTDGAIVARSAGVNLVVLRAGKHPMREIAAAMRVFHRNGVRVHGFVMNGVVVERGLGRKSAYHYQCSYK